MRLVGNGPLTHYVAGVFPENINPGGMSDKKFCFAYIDADTYQATREALEFFWPRMVPGGRIVVDDVPWEPCAGVEKAVRERFAPDQIQLHPEATAVVVTKP